MEKSQGLPELVTGSINAVPAVSVPETSQNVEEMNGAEDGSTALEMVVKGLAESDQPAALLAQALQELPEVQLPIACTSICGDDFYHPYFHSELLSASLCDGFCELQFCEGCSFI